MSYIVAQAPTAELRPGGEQTDEKDLMPYPLLDTIRQLFTCDNLLPEEIIATLKVGKEEQYRSVTLDLGVSTDEDIERCVRRFLSSAVCVVSLLCSSAISGSVSVMPRASILKRMMPALRAICASLCSALRCAHSEIKP